MEKNRRDSYRCQMPSGEQAAVLQLGETPLKGQLLNESASGFLVSVDPDPLVCVGQSAWLETTAGRYAVRIVHIQADGHQVYVGLRRTGDLLEPRKPCGFLAAWSVAGRVRALVSSDGLVFFSLVSATLLGVILLFSWETYPTFSWTAPQTNGTVRRRSPRPARPAVGRSEPGRRQARPKARPALSSPVPPATASGDPGRQTRLAIRRRKRPPDAAPSPFEQEAMRRLDRVKDLLSPALVATIGLTDEQRAEIRAVLDRACRSLGELLEADPQGKADAWIDDCLATLDEMDDQIRKILTESQHAIWAASDSPVGETAVPPPPDGA